MHIKICGLFREEDIDFVNEARPDYIGFVFAQSPRQVSTVMAQYLRFRLANGIEPVGVFVNAPVDFIANLYGNGVISTAQLHGDEDDSYIKRLKEVTAAQNRTPVTIIKSVKIKPTPNKKSSREKYVNADFLLLDSGAGSGKTFDWSILKGQRILKPWFLAGGINIKNIEEAIKYNPYGIDVSSGVETNGIKDRKKILEITSKVGKIAKKKENIHIISTTYEERYSRRMSLDIKG